MASSAEDSSKMQEQMARLAAEREKFEREIEATLALAEAAADLRALIKVKVADDQDLKTAQQAVAEAAHFFVAIQQEAAGLGVSADEQLQHYVQ